MRLNSGRKGKGGGLKCQKEGQSLGDILESGIWEIGKIVDNCNSPIWLTSLLID
jgi:hypothetical protein